MMLTTDHPEVRIKDWKKRRPSTCSNCGSTSSGFNLLCPDDKDEEEFVFLYMWTKLPEGGINPLCLIDLWECSNCGAVQMMNREKSNDQD